MSNKKSTVKIVAIVVSAILHVAGIYYLGDLALDYALPEGTVDSMEMSFDANGLQTETTEVAVMESAPQAPVVEQAPKTVPDTAPPTKTASPEIKTQDAAANVATQEQSPVVIPVSEPAPEIAKEEIPEDLIKDTFENDKTKETPTSDPLTEAPAAPTETPPVETAAAAPVTTPEQTSKPYGNTEGVKSDKVLNPMPGNKSHKVPYMARLRGMQGLTVVHYTVSAEGLVTDVKIVQSSGYSLLDDEASETIKTWKFKPTGEVGVYERPIRFRLSGDATEAPAQLRRTN